MLDVKELYEIFYMEKLGPVQIRILHNLYTIK